MPQNRSQPLHRIERMSAHSGLRESFLEEEMPELSCESTFIRQTECKMGNHRPKEQSRQRGRRESLVCDFNTTNFPNASLDFTGGSIKEVVTWSNDGNETILLYDAHLMGKSSNFQGWFFTICNAVEAVEFHAPVRCSCAVYSVPG